MLMMNHTLTTHGWLVGEEVSALELAAKKDIPPILAPQTRKKPKLTLTTNLTWLQISNVRGSHVRT
jgi:hypothetical protein